MVMLEQRSTTEHTTTPRRGLRTFADPSGRMSVGAAAALIVGWVASIGVLDAIAPAADPNVALTAWDLTLSLVYTIAVMGAAVGLFTGLRLGAMATIGGGVAMVAGSASCWAVDTSVLGSWFSSWLGWRSPVSRWCSSNAADNTEATESPAGAVTRSGRARPLLSRPPARRVEAGSNLTRWLYRCVTPSVDRCGTSGSPSLIAATFDVATACPRRSSIASTSS